MFIYDGLRSEYFGILVILSLILAFSGRLTLDVLRADSLIKYSLILLFGIGLLAWISFAYFGFPEYAKNRVEEYSWFLFIPLVYLMMARLMPDKRVLLLGIVLGCIVAFVRALLEEWKLVDELAWDHVQGRANGVMHPIRFGDLALLMAFIALAGSIFLQDAGRTLRSLGVLAFMAGVYASILSLSRGAWLAAPFFFCIIYLGWRRKSGEIFLRPLWLAIAILVILIGSAPFLKKGVDRFGKVATEIQMYIEGNPETSTGGRLSMLETAAAAFAQSPFFGVGVGGYSEFAKKYYDQNGDRLSSEVAIWKNPHNEMMLQAASRGLIGVALYFFAMLLAFLLFLRMKARGDMFYSLSGMMLIVGYFIFGMTIALFEHRDFLLFFAVYLPILMANARDCSEGMSNKARDLEFK